MAYFGCGTTAGKFRWFYLLLFTLIWIGLIVAAMIVTMRCEYCTAPDECERLISNQGTITSSAYNSSNQLDIEGTTTNELGTEPRSVV
jgi:hypothetical protein